MTTLYSRSVDAYRASLLRGALVAAQGNRTKASQALGLQRTYFVRLIKQYGITDIPAPKRVTRAA